MGKAKNRRSQSAGAVAEPGAATELARRRARKSSERAAGAARKERGHEARGTCLDVRRVLSVHGEKSVKTGRRDEDPSYGRRSSVSACGKVIASHELGPLPQSLTANPALE